MEYWWDNGKILVRQCWVTGEIMGSDRWDNGYWGNEWGEVMGNYWWESCIDSDWGWLRDQSGPTSLLLFVGFDRFVIAGLKGISQIKVIVWKNVNVNKRTAYKDNKSLSATFNCNMLSLALDARWQGLGDLYHAATCYLLLLFEMFAFFCFPITWKLTKQSWSQTYCQHLFKIGKRWFLGK